METESTNDTTMDDTQKVEQESPTPAEAEDAGGDSNAEATTETAEGDNEDAPASTDSGAAASGGGGGKQHYNRQAGRGARRHQPYSRGYNQNKAIYHQSNEHSDPSCRVYIGNLAWGVTWRELKDHMKQTACEITRADILSSPDGRSKGCGIVEFATEEGAKQAVLTMNDTELMGRQIFVREDREDGSGGGGYYTQQPGNGNSGATSNNSGATGGGGDANNQSHRVYVGNLSWNVTWQDLKDYMRDAGEVVHAEVMTESDGRSKGCGIVEFATAEDAKEAISTLTDTELKGRMIFVREDREVGSGGGGGHHGGGGFQKGGSCSVYVGNLAYETSWQDLKDHMRQAGNVDQANILQQEDGRSKGCGIVLYQNSRDAVRAIRELQNSVLHGRPVFVREDREQSGGRGTFRGGRGAGRAGNKASGGGGNGCQLFVGNLSYDTDWKELKDHFRSCGDVERAEVIEGPDGRKKGFGTVRFYKAEDATSAIETLNGTELGGRQLEVRIDKNAR